MAHDAGESHLTGALSVIDILVALYHGRALSPDDRLVFSKGHACHALYAVWASCGLLDPAQLATYAQPDSALPIHPCRHMTPLVQCSSGSLGHGLGVGVGIAYGLRLRGDQARVVVVLSDGPLDDQQLRPPCPIP